MFKVEWNRKFTTIAVYSFLVIAFSIMFYSGFNNFNSLLSIISSIVNPIKPIIYGAILAYLLNPVINFYEKKLLPKLSWFPKMKTTTIRALGIILTYLTAILITVGFLMIIIPQVVVSIYGIVSELPKYVSGAENLVNEIFASIPEGLIPPMYIERLANFVGNAVEMTFGAITSLIPAIFNFTVGFTSSMFRGLMAIIISLYILASKEKFAAHLLKIMYAFMSNSAVNTITSVGRTADRMFGGFINGKILDSFIIGILCFVSLSVMKMPNVILVSFIVGLTNIIPFFGPFIGAVPAFLIIFIDSPMQSLIFVIFVIVLQQLDGNVIGPMILGDSTGLSAFWVMFAILLFGGLFGVPGMIIGVPTFGVIYWIIKNIVTAKLKVKNMPIETSAYTNVGEDGVSTLPKK